MIGFGNIAHIAHFGFQMSVLAYDPYVSLEDMSMCSVQKIEQLDRLLAESDIVSIHTNLNPDTHYLHCSEQLALMKFSALLINVSRGGIIDEKALLRALTDGQSIGLDVFEMEPLNFNNDTVMSQIAVLDNVLLSPHIAWYTDKAGKRLQHKVMQKCR